MPDFHVYSTLAADVCYNGYVPGGDLPIRKHKVLIHGKANVVDKKALITPKGALTTVDAEQLAILEADPVFKMHKDNGYITVEQRKTDADKAAKNMTAKDVSAPKTPDDYKHLVGVEGEAVPAELNKKG